MQFIILKCFRSCGFLNGENGWVYGLVQAQLLCHNQLFCFCLTGLAVYHTNETHFPHWLSWRRLPLRRQRDWHCAEGSGTMALTLKVNHSDFAIAAASSTYFISVVFRSKWRRSELQRITSERCWRGPKQSTSRRHTAFRPGAPPRISWKS